MHSAIWKRWKNPPCAFHGGKVSRPFMPTRITFALAVVVGAAIPAIAGAAESSTNPTPRRLSLHRAPRR